MPITAPTPDQLRAVATRMGLTLSDDDLVLYAGLVQTSVDSYNVVDSLPDELPPVKYPREAGRRASADENPYNAWYWKARVEGSGTGKLAGRTVVLKDNVMLAGVPMMNGSSTLEGYIPNVDATLVTRLLDAGATIVGVSAYDQVDPILAAKDLVLSDDLLKALHKVGKDILYPMG